MKPTLPLLAAVLLFSQFALGQNFKEIAADDSGDASQSFSLDAKRLSVAFDAANDSMFFLLESWNKMGQDEDWGAKLGLDTDLDTSNGKRLQAWQDSSFRYDYKIEFFNNKFFPPTVVNLVDANDSLIMGNVPFSLPDSFSVRFAVPLSWIDDDTLMNIKAAGGSFDGSLYDNLPDSGYIELEADSQPVISSLPALLSNTAFRLYPNPTTGSLFLEAPESLTADFELIDLLGRSRIRKEIEGNERIDLSDLPGGIYVAVISRGEQRWSQRIHLHR